nr:hypothetical protein [Tanacetum cinerariifolium]
MLSDGFTNSQNNNKDALVDGKEHNKDIQKSVSPDIYSSSSGAQTRKQGDKSENKDKGKSASTPIDADKPLLKESDEAEYVAAASGCAQVLWIQNQLLDYG